MNLMLTQLPNGLIYAWIPRGGSTAVAKAILETHYPQALDTPCTLPANRTAPPYQMLLPRATATMGKRVIGLLGDPVERFRSACARTAMTVESGLTTSDTHFTPASELMAGIAVEWYRFPGQLAGFSAMAGIPVPERLEESEPGEMPELTAGQLDAVQARYAADLVMYNPPEPPVVLPSVPGEIANWRAKAVLGLAGLLAAVVTALDAMQEPARTVALAAWNGGADLARNGPTVLALAPVLGLTDAQVDDMFRQAAALEV